MQSMTRVTGSPTETDAVVVGAGPVGLFQAFQLGLQGIRCHVIDVLPHAGGQCIELYPDKPIYDVPGLPLCTGRELVERLLAQIAPFQVPLHLGQEVATVKRLADGRFQLETAAGQTWITAAVVVAGGVGSFQPRSLAIEGIADVSGTQLHHRLPERTSWAGQDVVIVGGGTDALEAALRCAAEGPERARSVTVVHRRDVFQAPADLVDHLWMLRARGALRFVAGQPSGIEMAGGRLQALGVTAVDGSSVRLALDSLLVLLGVSPKLGPIATWGLGLERRQVVVDTARFETDVPGIHAVGDINTYPGKRKLIVCGFHEATLAAFAIAARRTADGHVPLLYTTTSSKLHQRLGVTSEAAA